MTALWVEPASGVLPLDPSDLRRGLRLVEADRRRRVDGTGSLQGTEPWGSEPWGTDAVPVPDWRSGAAHRRRASLEVRRRRTLLAVLGLLLVALALPLSGTGGSSHATGSAPVETGVAGLYTVKSGDTLWSIAERADPSADPRPLVAELAKEIGSDTVVPGERLAVP